MQEIKAFNEQRAEIYWWLSGIFIRPLTPSELNAYHQPEIKAFLSGLGNNKVLKSATNKLIKVIRQIESDPQAHKKLADDFQLLYIRSDHNGPKASPCASAYVDDPTLPARKITELMQQKGIQEDSKFHEPADHLATELDLLSHMIIRSNELEKPEHMDLAFLEQKNFIEDDLLNWLPAFVKRCAEYDSLGFYRHVSDLLLNFCRLDSSYLSAGTSEKK
ncbi:molecular chaperone TorD [Vibrio albus]|uniref:Molecular chaperone TorD n=2 Tax=Vibrio albus TaxID=2200953 RepID=A0A2U3BF12_9VIBR|nr:molecular chaperone TorD [Vibrio albus]